MIHVKKVKVKVSGKVEVLLMLGIQPVTKLVKQEQKRLRMMYLDAIEANYSHEQMTPLNSILGNSQNILEDFTKFISQMDQLSADQAISQGTN